jgi:hypothetical protein
LKTKEVPNLRVSDDKEEIADINNIDTITPPERKMLAGLLDSLSRLKLKQVYNSICGRDAGNKEKDSVIEDILRIAKSAKQVLNLDVLPEDDLAAYVSDAMDKDLDHLKKPELVKLALQIGVPKQVRFEADQDIPAGVPSCPQGSACSESAFDHFMARSHPKSHPKLINESIALARGEVTRGTYKGAMVDVLVPLNSKCKTWKELQAYPKDRPKGPYRDVGIKVISSSSPQLVGRKYILIHS